MDNTTKKWVDGLNGFVNDGFINEESAYIDPELIKQMAKDIERKGIQFNTDRERTAFLSKFSAELLDNYNKILKDKKYN